MRRALVLLLALAAPLGCPQRARHTGPVDEPALPGLSVERRVVDVALPGGAEAHVGADLIRPTHVFGNAPAVIFVPGRGRASRMGRQPGDGVRNYKAPVDVTARWVRPFVEAGYLAFTFDHRSCGPKDDARCQTNPTSDLDAEGPVALARDVDSACALVKQEPGFDGRIVLFAHGQGVGPTLASACAKEAAALVLAAPIPRRVDAVMVEALRHRERGLRAEAKRAGRTPEAEALLQRAADLKNEAASLEATFASLEKGAFTGDARIWGATLDFWRGWIALTGETPKLLGEVAAPRVLVLGERDLQYAPKDRRAIRALAKGAGVQLLEVPGADHHLLTGEALDASTTKRVLEALEGALGGASPSG